MSSIKKKLDICIVSSNCLSSGPRVVKEADALAAAGYSVHVVSVQTLFWMREWDQRLVAGKAWSSSSVRMYEPSLATIRSKLITKAFGFSGRAMGCDSFHRSPFGERALSSSFSPLLSETRKYTARLYIGHNLAALPVVSRVAILHNAKFAFDAEDDHLGELPDSERGSWLGLLVQTLERKYLPSCAYVSSASEGISINLSNRYGISLPTPVHNVFALSSRQAVDGQIKERGKSRLSIYWYSQTLGLNRGLQDLLTAATRLKGSFEIHLRGSSSPEVKSELLKLVPDSELRKNIFFHEQVHPDELLSRTVEHDVGMALEQPVSQNRMSTVTNKLFFYFLGGLAVVATDTPGQGAVIGRVKGSGELYPFGDVSRLAEILQRFHDDPQALTAAKEASRRAADSLWNWENESAALVELVRKTLQ